jgi:hypothetical protein
MCTQTGKRTITKDVVGFAYVDKPIAGLFAGSFVGWHFKASSGT